MRIFEIRSDPASEVEIVGASDCLLSRVNCPQCEFRGFGFGYPTVDFATLAAADNEARKHFSVFIGHVRQSGIVNYNKLMRPPMTVEEFEALKITLAPVLGKKRPVLPRTSFGPMTGFFRGVGKNVDDFIWSYNRELYLKGSVFEEIGEAGFEVAGAPADFTFIPKKYNPGEPLIEVEFIPSARLLHSGDTTVCSNCGLIDFNQKGRVIDRTSLDESIPFQCLYQIPAKRLVSESLAEFIQTKNYSGVVIAERESV